MQSQLTVRIPDDLEKEISSVAKRLRLKRSDVVRMALEKFLEGMRGPEQDSPYEKVKYLIGSISSGVPNLGEDHRKYLVNRIRKGE